MTDTDNIPPSGSLLVVIPIDRHTRSEHLDQAITSVRSQITETDRLLLMVGDQPPFDNSELHKHEKENVSLLVNHCNGFHPLMLNKAMQGSKETFFAIQEANDISSAGRFESQKKILNEMASVSVVGSRALLISTSNQIEGSIETFVSQHQCPELHTRELYERINRYKSTPLLLATCMFRRASIIEVGGFGTEPPADTVYGFEILCQLLLRNKHLYCLPDMLVRRRYNDTLRDQHMASSNRSKLCRNYVWASFKRRSLSRKPLSDSDLDDGDFFDLVVGKPENTHGS